MRRVSKRNNFAIVLCSLRGGGRLGAALIVRNEINVSRNPNEAALLMKADQIRAMRLRLERREIRGVEEKRMSAKKESSVIAF